MKINIKTTTISLTPAISEYVKKRFDSLEKFFKDDSTAICDIELAKTSNHHKNGYIFRAEIHIVAKNKNLYASSEKEDLYSAIDSVKDEALREVKSSNEKMRSVFRKGASKVKSILKGYRNK